MNKIFIQLNVCLHLNLGCPSHATVPVWVKKQGISQSGSHDYYGKEKWVLIADESIRFGNKKILPILAVPEWRYVEHDNVTVFLLFFAACVWRKRIPGSRNAYVKF